ncbi:MAG: hypothetical protein QXJ07_06165 [Candidatus Bathyarchaeia archaeon]
MESQILNDKGLWKSLKRDAKCPFCGQPLTFRKTRDIKFECENPSCPLINVVYTRGVGVKFVFDTVMVSPLKAPDESGETFKRALSKTILGRILAKMFS